MDKQISWTDLVKKYDLFEQKLAANINDDSLTNFFHEISEIFQNNKFELWQIEEARDRTNKILETLQTIEQNLQAERLGLIDKSKQFEQYIRNTHIVKK